LQSIKKAFARLTPTRYLQHNEFTKTFTAFQEECKSKGRIVNIGGGLDPSKTLENKVNNESYNILTRIEKDDDQFR
jgi:hypothetical protein